MGKKTACDHPASEKERETGGLPQSQAARLPFS
jgi:hypothetical protein